MCRGWSFGKGDNAKASWILFGFNPDTTAIEKMMCSMSVSLFITCAKDWDNRFLWFHKILKFMFIFLQLGVQWGGWFSSFCSL